MRSFPRKNPKSWTAAKALFDGERSSCRSKTRSKESLAAWDEVVQRFGESQSPEVFQLAALALFDKAEALGELGSTKGRTCGLWGSTGRL